MVNDDEMLIGELNRQAGVTLRTVRYYESLGLLNTPACSGGFQTYGPGDLARLEQIAGFKQLGLSGEFMAAFGGENSEATGLERLLRRMEREEFDLIAVGRALLGDPNWV